MRILLQDFDVYALISDLLKCFSKDILEKKVQVEILVEEGLDLIFTSDRERAQSLLFNVIENAIRHAPCSSKIKMEIFREEEQART